MAVGSGGLTKYNRSRAGLAKSHTLDALCAGPTTAVASYPATTIVAKALGRGVYARTCLVTSRPCRHCGKTFRRSMEEITRKKTRAERAVSRCCSSCRDAGGTSDASYRCDKPRWRHFPRTRTVYGFATGDLVAASPPSGKYAGDYLGRVMVRSSGAFDIRTAAGLAQGVNHRHCRLIRHSDGWGWSRQQEGRNAP